MSLRTSVLEGDGLSSHAEGGWLHVQRPEPALAGLTAAELLTRSAQLPGNFRYGTATGAEVLLLGEVRERAAETDAAPSALAEVIEAALDASGFAWKRR